MKPARDVFASLLLAAACFHATTDGQHTCTEIGEHAAFTGYPDQTTTVATPNECSDQCAQNTSCVAFAVEVSQLNRCSTFSAVDSSGNLGADWLAGRCGPQLSPVNGDIPGNDLKHVKASDATRCSYFCEKTTGCNAYSWTSYNGGACWMKTELATNFVGATDGSVISGEVFRCGFLRPDTDFRGQDFASVQRSDWRDCCGVCRRTKGCVVSSWSNYNGGTCWLKKTSTGSFASPGVMAVYLK